MIPTAKSVEVAKAVTEHLRSVLVDVPCIVDRSYGEWELDLSNMSGLAETDADELRVDVVSHTTEQKHEASSRGTLQFMLPIDVAVRQRLQATEQDMATGRLQVEEIDKLVGITEFIHVSMTHQRLPDFDCAVWQSTKIEVCPMTEMLRTLRQFTSIVRTTFRVDLPIAIAE